MFVEIQKVNCQVNSFNICNHPVRINQKDVFVNCIDYKKDKFDYREALELAQQGIKKFPYNYKLRLKKALLFENLGNSTAAEKELIGLIKLYPNRQELHNYLGRIYYDKDRSKALLSLLKSIAIEPQNELGKENLIFVKRLLDGRPMDFGVISSTSKLDAFKVDDFDVINNTLRHLPRQRNITIEDLNIRLNIFFEALEHYTHRREGFFWEYYVPQYVSIYKENKTSTYVYYLSGIQVDNK